jgi:hypothetical protein
MNIKIIFLSDVTPYILKYSPMLAASFMLVSSLEYPSTLKIKAVRFSELSANFYRTARRHNPLDNTVTCPGFRGE